MRWLNFEKALITKDEGQSTNYKVPVEMGVCMLTYMRSCNLYFVFNTFSEHELEITKYELKSTGWDSSLYDDLHAKLYFVHRTLYFVINIFSKHELQSTR